MRITTFLLLLATIAYFVQGFNQPKCDHVFTAIEYASVEIEQPSRYGGMTLPMYTWPTGLHEGKELICVKCFHKQKQMLDYGQPVENRSFPSDHVFGINHLMDTLRVGACCPKIGWDTVLVTGPGGLRFVHGDSILNKKQ